MKLDYLSNCGTCEICGKHRSQGSHVKCSLIRKARNDLKLKQENKRLSIGRAVGKLYKHDQFKAPE